MQDFSVPDRPDRDRLIRIEGAHALRDAAARVATEKEDEDHIRWKEEQQRKKVDSVSEMTNCTSSMERFVSWVLIFL